MSAFAVQEVIRLLEQEDPLGLRSVVGPLRWRARLLQVRRYSRIFVLEPACDAETLQARPDRVELVLKMYRQVHPTKRRKEFDSLVRAYDGLGPGGGVVRPVAFYPEYGAVVTERAQGESLERLFRRACSRGGDRTMLARAAALSTAAGSWLREFQARGQKEVRDQGPGHLGHPTQFLQYLDERLRIVCGLRPGFEPAFRTRLLERVEATFASLPPGCLEESTWVHSDFGPHNLLADDDRLTVLDLELGVEHPFFDAAYFVESIGHLSRPFVDPKRLRRLERAFLAGYGQDSDSKLFTLFRLRHLLCSYVSEGKRGGIARLRQWPGLLQLRGRLRRLTQLGFLGADANAA